MDLKFADRSGRGKLRFSGPQDIWFLDQILTQSFEGMQPGDTRESAMLTPHGRMLGYVEFVRTEDAVLGHMEPELLATFPDEIRRYVFATQVEIDDVTEDFATILLAGTDLMTVIADVAPEYVLHLTRSLGIPAAYLWVPSAEKDAVLARLEAVGAERATEDEFEAIRIANGIPRWGKEMDQKTFPQEAGIEGWAVAFDKGCYLGQEAMAKIHFRGKVNRRLASLHGADLSEGDEVQLDGAKVGVVTSVSNGDALAIVKHTVGSGTRVTINDREVAVIS